MFWDSELGCYLCRIAQTSERAKSAQVLALRWDTETIHVYLFPGMDSANGSKLLADGKAQGGCKKGY